MPPTAKIPTPAVKILSAMRSKPQIPLSSTVPSLLSCEHFIIAVFTPPQSLPATGFVNGWVVTDCGFGSTGVFSIFSFVSHPLSPHVVPVLALAPFYMIQASWVPARLMLYVPPYLSHCFWVRLALQVAFLPLPS